MRTNLCRLAPALLIGCAHTTTIETAQTLRLPQPDRQAIATADENVEIAQRSVTAAQSILDEAQRFDVAAARELEAARSRLSASGDDALAMRQLAAAQAKKSYADRLIDLRRAELDERESFQRSSEADREWLKYEALARNGLAGNLRADDFEHARTDAQHELADKRLHTAELQGTVAALHAIWDERRRSYDVASRERTPTLREATPEPLKAPPPPEPLKATPEPHGPPALLPMPPSLTNPPPAGDVNEGPSSPMSVPE
jgi:hypothetical protein